MVNYQNGKIYKIFSLSHPELVYYGSTTLKYLSTRFGNHRNLSRTKWCSSWVVFQYDDARIVLVESFPCNSKDELVAKEMEYIQNNECVNCYKGVTRNSTYAQNYRALHADHLKECAKKWENEHKEHRQFYKHQWYERNKNRTQENIL